MVYRTRNKGKIKFSKMWDKLTNRKVGNQFTTIRPIWTETYYRQHVGDEFRIIYKGAVIGTAILEDITVVNIEEITDDIVKADTYHNWSKDDFERFMTQIYGSLPDKMVMLSLRWTEVKNNKQINTNLCNWRR